MHRLPADEDWQDYAAPCPCCGEPVLSEGEHYVSGTLIDPGWWRCDKKEEGNEDGEAKEGA